MHWLSGIVIAMLAFGAFGASPAIPSDLIRVRDYAVGDCATDDTLAINTAIGQWQALTASRTTGTLDFGSGCYRTTDTLHFGRLDSVYQFGSIRGDSPLLARIHPDASVALAADMERLKYSSVSGLGFYGTGRTPGTVGLLLSNTVPGMGTNNVHLDTLVIQNFGTCLQVGEPGGQAAAELQFDVLSVSYCNIGIYATGYNTLDLNFVDLNIQQSKVGFQSDQSRQATFVGGGGAGNGTTFLWQTSGVLNIQGWREEAPTSHFVWAGCCRAGTFVTVSGSIVYGNGGTEPLVECGGDCRLTIGNSFIGGRVSPDPLSGSTVITNSAIFDSAPWNARYNGPGRSGMFYRQEGNYRPDGPANLAHTLYAGDFPDLTGRAVNGHP